MSAEVAVSNNFNSLEKELEKARTNLKDLNENIKRIFGKTDNFSDRKRNLATFEASQRRVDVKKDRNFDVPSVKRRQDFTKVSAFNRLSGQLNPRNNQYVQRDDEADDFPRPKVSSRVISKEQVTSREDALALQARNNDLARNKRMFGSLLGTLQKFQKEESRLKPKEDKKAQIEKKLEEQELLEKEKLKQEKEVLMADRKRKQLEIRALEIKMFKLRDLKTWEDNKLKLLNFIGSKSEPQIFYLPKVMSPKFETLLKESQETVQQQIEQRRQEVHEEIRELELGIEGDIKALQDGKFIKSIDLEDELDGGDSVYNSDDENEQKVIKEVKREEETKIDKKRKRSYTPEPEHGRTVRSQVVIKREQDH